MKDIKRLIISSSILWLFILFILVVQASAAMQGQFKDVTARAGVRYKGETWGASWGDMNGDGWLDLWVGNHGIRGKGARLYRNNKNGTFTNVASALAGYRGDSDVHSAAWSDLDNDGDQDLFVTTGGLDGRCLEPQCGNQLFVNENGRFQDLAVSMGLDDYTGRERTPLWFDYNNDGRLDVFVGAYPMDGTFSKLFTNQTTGFENQHGDLTKHTSNFFAQLSLSNAAMPGARLLLVHTTEFPRHIFNYANSSLKPVSASRLGLPRTTTVDDMAVADFNGDLSNDLYIARTRWSDRIKLKDALYFQTAGGFTDRTAWAGITVANSCRSVVAADFDNDMDVDIYLVCGGMEKNDPNMLYENLGKGKLKAVPKAGGAAGTAVGRGESVAVADYDRDGFLDLFVTNGDNAEGEIETFQPGGPSQLFHNVGNTNHWLQVDLAGTVSNRDAVGARVHVTAGGVTQLREQNAGMHHKSQNQQRLHFGLGAHTMANMLKVYWPSGKVTTRKNIKADRIIRVIE